MGVLAALLAVLSGSPLRAASPAPADGRAAGARFTIGAPAFVLQGFAPDGRETFTRTAAAPAPRDVFPKPAVLVDSRGEVLVAGSVPDERLALARFSPADGLVWEVSWSPRAGAVEQFSAIAGAPGGRTLLATRQVVESERGRADWIVRIFAADGKLAGQRSLCFGACRGAIAALAPGPDGSVILAAIEDALSAVAKVGMSGPPHWTRVLEGVHVTGLAGARDGGVFYCGIRLGDGDERWEVGRVSRDGTLAWSRTHAREVFQVHPARAVAIAVLPQGGAVAAGTETGPAIPPAEDWHVRAFGDDGAATWSASYNSFEDRYHLAADAATAVAADASGHVYVAGNIRSGRPDAGHLLRKHAPDGTLLWSRTCAVSDAVGVAPDGTVIVAGRRASAR